MQATNWTSPLLTIPQFNSNDGTLCMVVVRLSANMEADLMVTNTGPDAASVTVTQHVSVNIQAPAPIANFSPAPLTSMQTINVDPQNSQTVTAGPSPVSSSQFFNSPSIPPLFTGAGVLNFLASANGDFTQTTNNGNANVVGTTTASAKVVVEYWVVPEPGTLSMLLIGGLALGHRRRRR